MPTEGIRRMLTRRIGRRGAALLFFSFLDFVYAFSLAKPPAEAARSTTLRYVAHVLPLPVWATLWTVVAVACLVGAFRQDDKVAFAFAMGLKVLWGGVFLLGWLAIDLDRGWLSAAIWLVLAGWVGIISTWPEPQFDDDPPPEEGVW